jgi:predicted ATP-grasp superfamily ATP-dependent carboligase
MRLCPDPALDTGTAGRLQDMTSAIARDADCQGYLEAEYLVTDAGDILVLEINPRVAGTMRIAALATAVPIFALHKIAGRRGALPAQVRAAEVPYSGRPFSDPQRGIFATSRLTVAAENAAELRERLRALAGPGQAGLAGLRELLAG